MQILNDDTNSKLATATISLTASEAQVLIDTLQSLIARPLNM
jgi:hypothetical protein